MNRAEKFRIMADIDLAETGLRNALAEIACRSRRGKDLKLVRHLYDVVHFIGRVRVHFDLLPAPVAHVRPVPEPTRRGKSAALGLKR